MSLLTGQKLVNPVGLQALDQDVPAQPPLDADSLTPDDQIGQTDQDDVESVERGEGLSERNRRTLVVLLAVALGGVTLTLIGLTLMQGAWWYSYGSDQPLSHQDRAHLEMIRGQLDGMGGMGDVVAWLDAALAPDADPSEVRYHLTTAWAMLRRRGDPALDGMIQDLQEIIAAVQGGTRPYVATPSPVPTIDVGAIEWPSN